MLHSITSTACKCLGITCPILKESFLPLFREQLACGRCSKRNFTSTYGNPLFLQHFHIQTNICFSKRSKTSISSKAVCPAARLPAEGLKLLCQCYPLVTTLKKHLLAAILRCKKYLQNIHFCNTSNQQSSLYEISKIKFLLKNISTIILQLYESVWFSLFF